MATEEVTLQIEGMTCGSCVSHVDKALRGVPGVTGAAVNLTTGMANVKGKAEESALVAAVEGAGYKARVLGGLASQTMREVRERGEVEAKAVKRRLWIGALAGIPVLLIDFFGDRLISIHSAQGMLALGLAQWALTTVVMAFTGWPFFVGAWRAVRHAAANMDLLVALGSGVAYVYSVVLLMLVWTGRVDGHTHHGDFHAAVAIVVLVTLGKYLEARAKKRASSAVVGLATQAAATATRVLADGKTETVPAERIAIGDMVQVLAHQQLPVDGVLMEGHGALDMSVVTGESVPVELVAQPAKAEVPVSPPAGKRSFSLQVMNAPAPKVAEGPVLPGGATLSDGRIVIRATSTAATSTVARILDLVNNAQASKTQIQALADWVAGIFVPIVLVLSLGNFAVWMLAGQGWEKALVTTIATIIIACPCAMGLATPTAITVAMGRAAKLGILFTQASALESGRRIGTVVFDKTGTLTTGKLHLAETIGITAEGAPNQATHPELTPAGQRAMEIAASLEQYSEHPIAKAIAESGRRFDLPVAKPERFSSMPGGGLSGRIDGREYVLGSVGFIEQMGVRMDAVAADIERLRNDGKTLVALAEKGTGEPRLMGLFALQDTLRPEAREAVKALRDNGIEVGVLSGDTELAVRAAVHSMPVDFLKSGIKPQEKAAAVETLKLAKVGDGASRMPAGVAFVGDGINDGPALAAADLGIAMASGADIAKAAGDVLLVSNHLSSIPAVFELSRRTLRVIKQNLFWAFAYNVAAIPLAMAGILPPAFAAAAMMFSSLSVVVNALRLYRVPLK